MNALGDLLNSYEIEAFRLETSPAYDVEGEKEDLANFFQGKITRKPERNEFLDNIRAKNAKGAKNFRTRLIREVTPYIVFETNTGYIHYAENGITLNIVTEDEYQTILKDCGFDQDIFEFWLFDNKHLVKIHYTETGKYLGNELLDIDIAPFIKLKERFKAVGVSLEEAFEKFPGLKFTQ